MGQIIRLLFIYLDGSSIKKPTKVDMPLNKETKLHRSFSAWATIAILSGIINFYLDSIGIVLCRN